MAKFFWDHMRILPRSKPQHLCFIGEVLELQEELFKRKMFEDDPYNFLLFSEHTNIYTYGGDKESVGRFFRDEKDQRGDSLPAGLVPVKRGGSIAYHGPGQLVCYLIIDLNEIGIEGPQHLGRTLDEIIKEALEEFGIQGYSLLELIANKDKDVRRQLFDQEILFIDANGEEKQAMAGEGVWVITEKNKVEKIASRAQKVLYDKTDPDRKKLITKFGFSMEISTDLLYYEYIFPGGLDIRMTSVQELTGKDPKMPQVAKMVAEIAIRKFTEIYDQSHPLADEKSSTKNDEDSKNNEET